MSQGQVDQLKKAIRDTSAKVQESLAIVEKRLNEGTADLSTNVRKGVEQSLYSVNAANIRLKEMGETAKAHYAATEDTVLEVVRGHVKDGVQWCRANPYGAYAGAAAAVLLFPGPRTFVLRNIFGIFQSQESAFRAATERFSTASEASKAVLVNKEKTMEAGKAAFEALKAAKAQAGTARAELDALAHTMENMNIKFDRIQEVLAPLKHKDVITMQTKVAREASELQSAQKDVKRLLSRLNA